MNLKTIQLLAGKRQEIGAGRFIRLLSASAGEPITVETRTTNGEGDDIFNLIENIGAECEYFYSAMIRSEVDQVITIAWSPLSIDDNRLGVGDDTILRVDGNQAAQGLPMLTATGDAEVLTVPANQARKSLILQADSGNAGIVWLGGESANVGLPMVANDTITIEVKDAFKMFATNANAKVYALEVI